MRHLELVVLALMGAEVLYLIERHALELGVRARGRLVPLRVCARIKSPQYEVIKRARGRLAPLRVCARIIIIIVVIIVMMMMTTTTTTTTTTTR